MTNALWQMAAHAATPAARRAMGYRAFGETTAVHAARARVARSNARRRTPARRTNSPTATTPPASAALKRRGRRAAAEARRRIKALSDAAATAVESALPSRRAHAGRFLGEKIDERRGGGEGGVDVGVGVGVCVRRGGRRVAALLRGRRRPTEDGDEGGEGTVARGVRANTGTFVGAFAGASWGVSSSPAPVKFPWTTEGGGCAGGSRGGASRGGG